MITYVLSGIQKSLAFEWIVEALKKTHSLSFILINGEGGALHKFLLNQNIPVETLSYDGKKDLVRTVFMLIKIYHKLNTKIVHAHLFEAGYCGILAAYLAGVKKRIYTRHYATLNHEYYPHAVKIDRFINYLATDLVAISPNVQDVLINLENVHPNKIHLIPHGFVLQDFQSVSKERIEKLRKQYDIHTKPVIGVIARYVHLKGIQYIIPAFAQFYAQYPEAILLLANAGGTYQTEIAQLLTRLPNEAYRQLPFVEDLPALYGLMDVYIHVPINAQVEAFGQTYIEALAAGVPAIFTLSGIAPLFIQHQYNAWVVPFANSDEIYLALLKIWQTPLLVNSLVQNGRASIDAFNLDRMIQALARLYVLQ